MGGSYGHVLARAATQDSITRSLGDDRAFLATMDDTVLVFSEAAVSDPESVAVELSALVVGDIVGFSVFDDDILSGALCRGGEIIASFCVPSIEEYFGIDGDELELMAEYLDDSPPGAGSENDSTRFVMEFGAIDARRALAVLDDSYRAGERVFATERHRDLLEALGLPAAAAGWDYYQFATGIEGFAGPTPTSVEPKR